MPLVLNSALQCEQGLLSVLSMKSLSGSRVRSEVRSPLTPFQVHQILASCLVAAATNFSEAVGMEGSGGPLEGDLCSQLLLPLVIPLQLL